MKIKTSFLFALLSTLCNFALNMRSRGYFYYVILCFLLVALMSSCTATRYLSQGVYMLSGVEVKSDGKLVDPANLSPYVRQKPNSKWFSMFKVPLFIYSFSGKDTTKWVNRTIKNLGEAPVVFDTLAADRSARDMLMAMQNMGFMHSSVSVDTRERGKKLKAIYTLHPGAPFYIGNVDMEVLDETIDTIAEVHQISLRKGDVFTISGLDEERKRITRLLTNRGYYRFHKDFIQFQADTTSLSNVVDLHMRLLPYKASAAAEETAHPRYLIDTVMVTSAVADHDVGLRPSVLRDNIA